MKRAREPPEWRRVYMDNSIFGMRKINISDELYYLPLGSVIKVIWYKSDCYENGEECFGTVYGNMVGWESGNSDELKILTDNMRKNRCEVYLADDKVLALEHLYQIFMKNIDDIQSRNVETLDDKSYGHVIAFTDIEHRINELLQPELY